MGAIPNTHMFQSALNTHSPLSVFVAGFVLSSMYFVFMLLLLPLVLQR